MANESTEGLFRSGASDWSPCAFRLSGPVFGLQPAGASDSDTRWYSLASIRSLDEIGSPDGDQATVEIGLSAGDRYQAVMPRTFVARLVESLQESAAHEPGDPAEPQGAGLEGETGAPNAVSAVDGAELESKESKQGPRTGTNASPATDDKALDLAPVAGQLGEWPCLHCDLTFASEHARTKHTSNFHSNRTTPANRPASNGPSAGTVFGVVVLILIVVFAIIGIANGGYESSSSGSTPDENVSSDDAGLACDHFRNSYADLRSSQITDAEFLAKAREIRDDAVIGTEAMQQASRDLVAALVDEDILSRSNALRAMDQACEDMGH